MATTPNLLSVAKIWDHGANNAFTDLLRFDDRWWCTFREAEEHGPSIGTVRVITSEDGADWQSVAVLEEQEVDLRDPKLSVTPDGRLMLVMGGCVYGSGEHGTRSPRIASIVRDSLVPCRSGSRSAQSNWTKSASPTSTSGGGGKSLPPKR